MDVRLRGVLILMGTIEVTYPSLPPLEEYVQEIKSIWDSHRLTNAGPKQQVLEQRLTEYFQVPCCTLIANGHLALELGIQALGLTGEIITTPFTFASTTQAIVHSGCTPVFCDIDPATCCIDADKIESLITERTTGILPVHVYGNICDVEKIHDIAQKHGFKVLYDAAHAFGESVNGIPIGNFGDLSAFSFHATKVFNTVEGGSLTCADPNLCKALHAMREFGMYGKENAEMIGINAKMTEFHAAMGLCNLRHVSEEISKRRAAARYYRNWLSDVSGLVLLEEQPNVSYNYSYFPVFFDSERFGHSRDEVCGELERHQIVSRKYFYPLTSRFSAYDGKFTIADTPVAQKMASQVLTLPLSSALTKEQIDRICKVILDFR